MTRERHGSATSSAASARAIPCCGLTARSRTITSFGPRLTEAQLEAFEAAYGVTLPAEYRWFLRELGDGGPGPAYGLLALTSQGLDLGLAVAALVGGR